MTPNHPLERALDEWLPELDFAVLSHGFAPHGRDYIFVLQSRGTYKLTLTHVTELSYETRVRDDVWPSSWDDSFTSYKTWEEAGEPDGYVWGTDWSLADPGLTLLHGDQAAEGWSKRLGRAMSAVCLETDRFLMRLVFHDARSEKLSGDSSVVDRVIIPFA